MIDGASNPLVVIVSGPSGSGKSTLVNKILDLPDTMLSVSCTTRPPRRTESEGKWYNFIGEEEFQRMADAGEFLEYAQVFGRSWYGTPRRWLDEARSQRKDLILEIDVQGAAQVRQKLSCALAIFILPPSVKELEQRIRERGQDSPEEIERRLQRARQEVKCFVAYDYAVVNDNLERAGREVQAVVLAARCDVKRGAARFQRILQSLGG
jgi:guanylate kinase